MSRNKVGLIVGFFFALLHLAWSLLVAITPLGVESFMNWVLRLHHITMPFAIITPFVPANAFLLVIITFIVGYILGWALKAVSDTIQHD